MGEWDRVDVLLSSVPADAWIEFQRRADEERVPLSVWVTAQLRATEQERR